MRSQSRRLLASRKVSPKGISSGIRKIRYFINGAGESLPAARKQELEKAKAMLPNWARAEK
jgi:tRNA(adenine34) deaminase